MRRLRRTYDPGYFDPSDPTRNEYGGPTGESVPGKRSRTEEHVDQASTAFRRTVAEAPGEVPYRREMESFFDEDFSGVRASVGRGAELGRFGASAAALGEEVAFTDTSPAPGQVAHELTHVVQHRRHGSAALAFDGGVSDPGDAAELEARAVAARYAPGAQAGPITAAPRRAVHLDPGDAAAIAANEALGLPSDAVQSIRRALGLAARGGLDAPLSIAVGERQRAASLPVTGILDEATLRAIPFETARAITWYRGASAQPWAQVAEGARAATLARVIAAIHAPADSASWGAGRGGPQVTEAFVRAAIAWQMWQRSALTADGQLGASSFVRMGIPVEGAPGAGVALNTDGLARGARDPRLAELLEEDTFASRCLAELTNGGRSARLGDLRGETNPTLGLGSVSGGFGPRQFLARMFQVAPDVVRRAFFGEAGGERTLEDVYTAVGLAPAPAEGAPDRLSSMTASAGYDEFVALLRTPEAARVQLELFSEGRIAAAESAASTLVSGSATNGTVALLALLEGVRPEEVARRVPDGDEGAVQAQIAVDYTAPDRTRYPAPTQAFLTQYARQLVDGARTGAAAPEFAAAVEASEASAGVSYPFARDSHGRAVTPDRLRQLAAVVARFRDVWTQPYNGALGPVGGATASAGPSAAAAEEGAFPSIITPHTAVVTAIDGNRTREPPFNPEWVAAMQQAIGAARTGRFTEGTVQFVAQFQRDAGVSVSRAERGVIGAATLTALQARFPTLATIPVDAAAAPLAAGTSELVTAAQTTERPDHEAVYDERQASPATRVEGMPLTWDTLMSEMGTYSFLGLDVTGHRRLLQRLHAAATYLRMRYPGRTDAQIAREVRLTTGGAPGGTQLRANTTTSYHVFGLAVDINYSTNPWTGGDETLMDEGESRRDPGNPHVHAARRGNRHAIQAIWMACWLMGRGEPIWPQDSDERTGRETTDELWSHFHESSAATEAYFALRGHADQVTPLLANLAREPRALPDALAVDAAERTRLRTADAATWLARIELDWSQTHGTAPRDTTWGARRAGGFMNQSQELVRALRDAGGLAWGACDIGHASSGDMMHFDARPEGNRFEQLREAIRRRTGDVRRVRS